MVLCQTGDPIISMNLELINSDLILPSLPYTSHVVLSIIVVHMIKSSRSIDDVRMVNISWVSSAAGEKVTATQKDR